MEEELDFEIILHKRGASRGLSSYVRPSKYNTSEPLVIVQEYKAGSRVIFSDKAAELLGIKPGHEMAVRQEDDRYWLYVLPFDHKRKGVKVATYGKKTLHIRLHNYHLPENIYRLGESNYEKEIDWYPLHES